MLELLRCLLIVVVLEEFIYVLTCNSYLWNFMESDSAEISFCVLSFQVNYDIGFWFMTGKLALYLYS